MKRFNTTGICIPNKHYMADTSQKIHQIIKLIDEGSYFTINRPRQYGKTTILYLLKQILKKNKSYYPVKISFEGIGSESYKKEALFIEALMERFISVFENDSNHKIVKFIENSMPIISLNRFGLWVSKFIKIIDCKVVLFIDEIDKSTNNQLFIDFLSVLRSKYLSSKEQEDITFHSVVLVGVHDVKNLNFKQQAETTNIQFNSPWNIAADFLIDMSFSPDEICPMLKEYTFQKNVNMDEKNISLALHDYTSGYPFLVCLLCKTIDEVIMPKKDKQQWEINDVEIAVQIVIKAINTNFESLIKNLEKNRQLYNCVRKIVLEGELTAYIITDPIISIGTMYGILKNENDNCKIHNKIYEQLIYNHMVSKIVRKRKLKKITNYNYPVNFVKNNKLIFEKVLIKFQMFMKEQYSRKDINFLEKNGRLIFLAFLKPIINGYGFDFKEVQISEEKRLDVVVTYLNKKYVVELKKWYGKAAHEKGLKQLENYLQRLSLKKGYLIIFDFRSIKNKQWKSKRVKINDKTIFMIWV